MVFNNCCIKHTCTKNAYGFSKQEIYIYMVFGMSIVSSFSRRKQRFRMTLFCMILG
ncbi:Os05g0145900 [Oryza sativa Japonica Group]|uniref:Os05g0145900 protein n=1 Tax=Oryza sativa subsp. japonica TaxID=39947 RepID=Q6ASR9_ORYSJ|nr:unknown protein [Oryza sativa Japonica Group]AAT94003.1 unknown protein [Oryza sativa Japonica Group]KAF2929128.1 hypothetical protein DAI22_05g033800 [Oryza sativa Japonica Group]BAF16549.1 Os05g0145900 [Oryza sativa Japonica Group]|eukprot:NP_001054635.1 Os05g0145900 [Oryza sativa Japonica Group]